MRVGWVIGDQLERGPWVRESTLTSGGVGLARYYWLARHVNADKSNDIHHEVYRAWRRYDLVVFLKSMGPAAAALMRRLQNKGIPGIFDANVNYFQTGGTAYYVDMLPREDQVRDGVAMATAASGVIADSEFIAGIARGLNERTRWIPDNVPVDLIPFRCSDRRAGPLRLLWCGQAVKLFELLAVKEVLLSFKRHFELVLVTNDTASAFDRLYPQVRTELEDMLAELKARIVDFQSIQQLFKVYDEGGVFLSPRFLDSPYNRGHTEWKITLAMACGRVALCSPLGSYVTVRDRASGRGIRVLEDDDAWRSELEGMLSGKFDWSEEEAAARSVVEKYYSTDVVAAAHAQFLREIREGAGGEAIASSA